MVKASAVDKLYSTRAGNIYWVTDAIVDAGVEAAARRVRGEVVTDIDMVNLISACKRERHPKSSRCASFASKYCHFFVEGEFPIYDSFALMAVNQVLGAKQYGLTPRRSEYRDFCERVERLRVRDGLESVSTRDMDRFLWLWGQWIYQTKSASPRAVINADVYRVLFQTQDGLLKKHVEALQPK